MRQFRNGQPTRSTRVVLWAFAALAAAVLMAPLAGYLLTDTATAQTAAGEVNERSEFWRAVREGSGGYSAVKGPETNVLIQNGGENWRALREGPLASYSVWLIGGMVAVLALFYLIWGKVRLQHGRSGYTVERWTLIDRVLHWFTAISFIVLAVTGFSLMYGREVLIPFLGKDGFAAYAIFAKNLHNYLGPFFAVSLLIELLKWVRHNIPTWTDVVWFLKGGGLIFKSVHPSAGRMNAGEKVWFWILFWLGGVALVASGFVMNFPGYGQTREIMQYGHIVHVIAAVVLTAVALGHIYIGTLGTEGALEGMVTGRVDTNWAKQHHDLWYEELLEDGVQPDRPPGTAPDPGRHGARQPS